MRAFCSVKNDRVKYIKEMARFFGDWFFIAKK